MTKNSSGFAQVFVVVLFLVGVASLGLYFLSSRSGNHSLSLPITSPSPTPSPTPNMANWKTYKNGEVSFSFPSAWTIKTSSVQGTGITLALADPGGKFAFSYSSKGNYNPTTGKPYVTIDEYVGLPYQVGKITVGGLDGRQPLPRAGSENVNRAVFFSNDLKSIYTLELKTGDSPLNTPMSDIDTGSNLFKQIIASFKFLN